MNLEDITLSDLSQSQKDKYCVIPGIPGTYSDQFIKTESGMVVASGQKEGRMRSYCLIGTEFQFGKMKMFGDK